MTEAIAILQSVVIYAGDLMLCIGALVFLGLVFMEDGMTYSAEPSHVESFREATGNHEKMRGSMFITFRCPDCGQSKSIKGRKSRGWKAGYRCSCCHAKKVAK